MRAASAAVTPTTPPSPLPHSRLARSHNRRFHGRFPGVHCDEHLLNYYSCALVADILLQGHLYITENYFAFYSNIFGRKTQILLPVGDIIKVTKERTAKIIPNAVGLYTTKGKYVFGSLLQRNTTYRLMQHVWLKSADPDSTEEASASDPSEPGTSDEALRTVVPPPPVVAPPSPPLVTPPVRPDEPLQPLATARRRRKSDLFPRISAKAAARGRPPPIAVMDQITLRRCNWECAKGRTFSECFNRLDESVHSNNCSLPKSTLLLLAATFLLVVLFVLATILVYRVATFPNRSVEDAWHSKSSPRFSNYLELLKQQQEEVEAEIARITATLKNRLSDLGQVRQSIDQISNFAKKSSFHMQQENADQSSIEAQTPS